jgi:hypothetical protein
MYRYYSIGVRFNAYIKQATGNEVAANCGTRKFTLINSVADPGYGAIWTPGSGIRNKFFPDPGSRIPNPYFCELSDKFLGKSILKSFVNGLNFLYQF